MGSLAEWICRMLTEGSHRARQDRSTTRRRAHSLQRYVRDEVTMHIKNGFITEITGTGTDAFVLRDYFESWKDPNAFAVSHVGWGFHQSARWSALDVYDADLCMARSCDRPRAILCGRQVLIAMQTGTRPLTSTFRCAAARSR